MADGICAGCELPVATRKYRGGQAAKWCSERCRQRSGYPARRDAGLTWFPRCAVMYGDCSECSKVFVSSARRVSTCGFACSEARRKRLARERHAANPQAAQERVRKFRAAMSPASKAAAAARRREWVARNGRVQSTIAAEHRRRARLAGGEVEKFANVEIFERDGWKCGICRRAISPGLAYPDPMSVSLDHIVPISRGGGHTRANTRASHLSCNVRRGIGRDVADQLALL